MSVGPNDPFSQGGSGQQPGFPSAPQANPFPASPQPGEMSTLPPQRPGTVTGAAVVGFVTAGFEIIGGLLWMLGGSVIGSVEDTLNTGTAAGGLIAVMGLVSLAVGGIYIWGGIMALKRSKGVLLGAACGGAALNIIALALFEGGLLSLILAAVVILLLCLPQSRVDQRR